VEAILYNDTKSKVVSTKKPVEMYFFGLHISMGKYILKKNVSHEERCQQVLRYSDWL
jgi:hypothetical protein